MTKEVDFVARPVLSFCDGVSSPTGGRLRALHRGFSYRRSGVLGLRHYQRVPGLKMAQKKPLGVPHGSEFTQMVSVPETS
jgi:hypothetical protein